MWSIKFRNSVHCLHFVIFPCSLVLVYFIFILQRPHILKEIYVKSMLVNCWQCCIGTVVEVIMWCHSPVASEVILKDLGLYETQIHFELPILSGIIKIYPILQNIACSSSVLEIKYRLGFGLQNDNQYHSQKYFGENKTCHKMFKLYEQPDGSFISKCIYLNENYEFRLKFHWSLFLRVQLTIFQHWFR